MDDTFWHHKTLLRHQFYNFVFKIYKELALENEKEFVIIIMLVPMVLALHDSKSNHRIVNFGKSLVVPLIGACFDQSWDVNQLQRLEFDIHVIRALFHCGLRHCHFSKSNR